jgi:hypothetical protein
MPKRVNSKAARTIAGVRRTLRELDRSLAALSRALATSKPEAGMQPAGKARRLKLSPARQRALRLHGRYLGYIRQLKPRQKAEVRALRAKRGVKAAIARARKLAT